jgi:glycosyltransferase involved in cell wall biosynthesis
MKPFKIFFDIAPLGEFAWTGIANVTAGFARHLVQHYPDTSVCFSGADAILPWFVRTATEAVPGGYLRDFIVGRNAVASPLHTAMQGDAVSVGVFPNKKPVHRLFDIELTIVHDLSSILLPEMHPPEVAAAYAESHMRDAATSDLLCCVSEATRQDVISYLSVPPEKAFVSHLGCDANPIQRPDFGTAPIPPYVVVLGTVEPRKNLQLVAEFIRCRPEICRQVAFMFVGRRGWGAQFEDIFGQVLSMPECQDRIFFTGFLTDADKHRLLAHAAFSIYPSLFEGFGLPVIECMAAGCPVITSRSSSLVELGLDPECYFDPFSVLDFGRAFDRMMAITSKRDARERLARRLADHASKFKWSYFSERIMDRIRDEVRRREAGPLAKRPADAGARRSGAQVPRAGAAVPS